MTHTRLLFHTPAPTTISINQSLRIPDKGVHRPDNARYLAYFLESDLRHTAVGVKPLIDFVQYKACGFTQGVCVAFIETATTDLFGRWIRSRATSRQRWPIRHTGRPAPRLPLRKKRRLPGLRPFFDLIYLLDSPAFEIRAQHVHGRPDRVGNFMNAQIFGAMVHIAQNP